MSTLIGLVTAITKILELCSVFDFELFSMDNSIMIIIYQRFLIIFCYYVYIKNPLLICLKQKLQDVLLSLKITIFLREFKRKRELVKTVTLVDMSLFIFSWHFTLSMSLQVSLLTYHFPQCMLDMSRFAWRSWHFVFNILLLRC